MRRYTQLYLIPLLLLLCWCSTAQAQFSRTEVRAVTTLPATCQQNVILNLIVADGANAVGLYRGNAARVCVPVAATGAGSGTVTSVSMSTPGVLFTNPATVTNPTTTPAIALSLISQTANRVLAAPNGSSGTPTFRALALADLPTLPYDTATQVDGKPANSAVVLRFVAPTAYTLSASGHQCKAATAATAQTDFVVAVNGTTKATLRFAASGTTCSIVSGASASVAVGDVVTITAPASADATLADFGISLKGNQ